MTPEEKEAFKARQRAKLDNFQARNTSSPNKGKKQAAGWGDLAKSLLQGAGPAGPALRLGQDLVDAYQGRLDPNMGTALTKGVTQGVSLGLADDAVAGALAVGNDSTYDANSEMINESGGRIEQQFPISTLVGELLGGGFTGVGLGKAGVRMLEKAPKVYSALTGSFWRRALSAGAGAAVEGGAYAANEGGRGTDILKSAAFSGAAGVVGQGLFGELLPRLVSGFSSSGKNPRQKYDAAAQISQYLRDRNIDVNTIDVTSPDFLSKLDALPSDARALHNMYPDFQTTIKKLTSDRTHRTHLQPLVDSALMREKLADEKFAEAIAMTLQTPELRTITTLRRDGADLFASLSPKYDTAFAALNDAGASYPLKDIKEVLGATYSGKGENLNSVYDSQAVRTLTKFITGKAKTNKRDYLTPRELQNVVEQIDQFISNKSLLGKDGNTISIDKKSIRKLLETRSMLKEMLHSDSDVLADAGMGIPSLRELDGQYSGELAIQRSYNAGYEMFKSKQVDSLDLEAVLTDPKLSTADTASFMEGVKAALFEVAESAASPTSLRKKLRDDSRIVEKLRLVLGTDKADALINSMEDYAEAVTTAKHTVGNVPIETTQGKTWMRSVADVGLMAGTVPGAISQTMGTGAAMRTIHRGVAPMDVGQSKAMADILMQEGGAPDTVQVLQDLLKRGYSDMHNQGLVGGMATGAATGAALNQE